MKVKIGEKIRELRKQRDVTQEQLAAFLGVTNQAVSKWESENGYPDIEYVVPIAEFFKVTTDFLLDYNPARIDDIDMSFVSDENILGKWVSIKWVNEIFDDFEPTSRSTKELYYESVEFLPGGELRSVFENKLLKSKWTKGFTLMDLGYGNTANTYEIRKFDQKEYLLLQWKNENYTRRGENPSYYIFVRESYSQIT